MPSNYETLGLSTPGYTKEGVTPVAVTKVEVFNQDKQERKNDIAIKVFYKPNGRGEFEYNFLLSGDYKRNTEGKIIAAGSAFVVMEFFDALGVVGVNVDGGVNEDALVECQAITIENDNPLIENYTCNLYLYMYRIAGEAGKVYWRTYRRVLPIGAKEADIRRLVGNFEKDVKQGYVKPLRQSVVVTTDAPEETL